MDPVAVAPVQHEQLALLGGLHQGRHGPAVDAQVDQAGLRPVSQVSIDETWSALRFRPKDRVGR